MFECLAECFIPASISTPIDKLIEDVRQFVLPNCANDDLLRLQGDAEVWRRVTDIAERLEFIDRMTVIMREIKKATTEETKLQETDGEILCTKTFKCKWLGCDFAGVDRDIESLIIYLLVAVLDEMKNNDEKVTIAIACSFTTYLDKPLQQEWLSHYCALKEGEQGDILGFKNDDYNLWKSKSETERLEKIGRAVANIRHLYTHRAKRTFECDLSIGAFPRTGYKPSNESRLVKCGVTDRKLVELLWDTVQSVAKNRFMSLIVRN